MKKCTSYLVSITLVLAVVFSNTPIITSYAAVSAVKACIGGTVDKTYYLKTQDVTVTAESNDTSIVMASVTGHSTAWTDSGVSYGTKVSFQGISAGTTTVNLYANGKLNTTVSVEVADHKWRQVRISKAATCAAEGIKDMKCSVCDATTTEPIPKTRHTLNHVDAITPTCTKEGQKQYWKCSVCNGIFSDSLGKNETTLADLVVPTRAHPWESEYTIDQPPTYWADGSKSIHCSVCHTIKEGSSEAVEKTKVPTPVISKTKKKGKNKLTISWKKISGTTRYEFEYATKKSFSNASTISIASTSYTLKNLKAKKTYYFRVRSGMEDDSTEMWAFSSWSKTKKLKYK